MIDFSLRPVELAGGTVLGTAAIEPWDAPTISEHPRSALERVIRTALERPPCVVSFSGGRDSSIVLAVAAHVARREGLPAPVPVTLRFPDSQTADESSWQELVVRHLELPDWQRLEYRDELDIVGPVAAGVLRRHGVLWPFNSYFHGPIADHARGGSVLTGVGGDEVFSAGWEWQRANLMLTGQEPLRRRHLRNLALALSPRPARRAALGRRMRQTEAAPVTWLRPAARAEIAQSRLQAAADQPIRYDRCLAQFWWPRRSRLVGQHALDSVVAGADATCTSPLTSGPFLAALAGARGARMFRSRTEAVAEVAGDLLPRTLVDRSSKAWFDDVFFHRWAREFARGWDGSGVDTDIVDVEALRRAWSRPDGDVDARSYLLLQSVWLAQQPALS